jgi:hypothetical protein
MTPDYATGPGRRPVSRGAVLEVYLETGALERDCPTCGAVEGSFCVWDESGRQRRVPCKSRWT